MKGMPAKRSHIFGTMVFASPACMKFTARFRVRRDFSGILARVSMLALIVMVTTIMMATNLITTVTAVLASMELSDLIISLMVLRSTFLSIGNPRLNLPTGMALSAAGVDW